MGWELEANEVDELEAATNEIEKLARQAVDHAVRRNLHAALGIPESVWPSIRRSWERQEPSLYGRMDLRYNGSGPPLLLEYNADTPTSLFEASVVQWEWLTCVYPDADQFNSLHEALIAAWPGLRLPHSLHLTCQRDSREDFGTVEYLRDTALQAGHDTHFLFIDEIGWDGRDCVDLAGTRTPGSSTSGSTSSTRSGCGRTRTSSRCTTTCRARRSRRRSS